MVKPGVSELASVVDDASLSVEYKLSSVSTMFLAKASALQKCEKRVGDAEAQRGVALVQRDALRADLEKQQLLKDKLELLCRELQKANKAVMADAKAVSAAEAAKRASLSEKFESGLGDISEKLNKHTADRAESLKESEDLREHLRKLLDRGALQDKHLEKAKETFELEKKLFEAQIAESNERQKASDALRDALEKQLEARVERETALTAQLEGYANRFQEFQTVISQSNEAFGEFKKESSAMGKQLKLSETRCLELERKSAKSDVALIKMLEEKETLAKQLVQINCQKEKLEGLCRALRGGVNLGNETENVDPAGVGESVKKTETKV